MHLLEPSDELLAGALGVAAVRVLGGLASVDEGHVTVLLVLLVQLVEDLVRVAVALITQQADDELVSHCTPDIRVLGHPQAAEERAARGVARIDTDGEPDHDEVLRAR